MLPPEISMAAINILFAASDDLNDILETVNGTPRDFKGTLNIHINAPKSIVAGRNLVLLSLLAESADFVDTAIAEHSESVVAGPRVSSWIIEGHEIHLGDGFQLVHNGLTEILDISGLTNDDAVTLYEDVMMKPEDIDRRHRTMIRLEPHERVAWIEGRQTGILLAFGSPNLQHHYVNPFLFHTDCGFIMTQSSEKLKSWSYSRMMASAKEAYVPKHDLMGAMFCHVRQQLIKFVNIVQKRKVKFYLTH
ncbi:hypothetical protein HDU76_013486 [Blyttiomyces sp. JEL0837]|nr:hypothetical protein HDU76_013486 [Blyttiomyces sp. JEL0837]